MTVFRTATPVANGGNWRYSAARSEFESLVLNGVQRSVNRKVQVSNPWSGAKSELETDPMAREGFNSYILLYIRVRCLAHISNAVLPRGASRSSGSALVGRVIAM